LDSYLLIAGLKFKKFKRPGAAASKPKGLNGLVHE
jgi:hypothetical protein